MSLLIHALCLPSDFAKNYLTTSKCTYLYDTELVCSFFALPLILLLKRDKMNTYTNPVPVLEVDHITVFI